MIFMIKFVVANLRVCLEFTNEVLLYLGIVREAVHLFPFDPTPNA